MRSGASTLSATTLQPRVHGAIDRTHAAPADRLEQAVVAQARPRGQRVGNGRPGGRQHGDRRFLGRPIGETQSLPVLTWELKNVRVTAFHDVVASGHTAPTYQLTLAYSRIQITALRLDPSGTVALGTSSASWDLVTDTGTSTAPYFGSLRADAVVGLQIGNEFQAFDSYQFGVGAASSTAGASEGTSPNTVNALQFKASAETALPSLFAALTSHQPVDTTEVLVSQPNKPGVLSTAWTLRDGHVGSLHVTLTHDIAKLTCDLVCSDVQLSYRPPITPGHSNSAAVVSWNQGRHALSAPSPVTFSDGAKPGRVTVGIAGQTMNSDGAAIAWAGAGQMDGSRGPAGPAPTRFSFTITNMSQAVPSLFYAYLAGQTIDRVTYTNTAATWSMRHLVIDSINVAGKETSTTVTVTMTAATAQLTKVHAVASANHGSAAALSFALLPGSKS
jgi:type VI protein secretion system component Hcp